MYSHNIVIFVVQYNLNDLKTIKLNKTLTALVQDPKCIFVCNHSGGKDSQDMYLGLREIIPSDRLIVIHAHLPEVEWTNTEESTRDL